MNTIFRNKTVVLLIALLILGSLISIAHNNAMEAGKPFALAQAVRAVLIPVSFVSHKISGVGAWFVYLGRPRKLILKENKLLRAEVKRLSRENATLKEASRENIELKEALGLRKSMPLQMLPAEIISRKASVWFDTAVIDKGSRSGVVKSAAVVNFRGLIGQIVESDLFTSQMVALTDPSSAVGAMVQRSRSSGIIQGQGADYLVFAYLPKDADIKEKDVIISSGMGRVIPKGFPIGRVIKVKRNSLAGTTSALVRPSVRLDQVEQVFVVKPGQSITSTGTQQ